MHTPTTPRPSSLFNDTATTEIYTLSLHDALPISCRATCPKARPATAARTAARACPTATAAPSARTTARDRKSTRLNSSHVEISYAVFCLKKKSKQRVIHLSEALLVRSVALPPRVA